MGDITIRIPQKIHIEYTLKSARLTGRILDLLNKLILRDDSSDRQRIDTDGGQLRLGDLALKFFGADAGVELELPQHTPHQPLDLEQ